jgi:putative MATE family efflux protein
MPAPSTPPPPALAPRTRRLLEGSIPAALVRLAAPNVVVILVQAGVATMEAYFVGWLGAEALAGVSLVFPLIMLTQTMSAGGMGGGVSSAIARALGGGRPEQASRLALHALVIAVVMGLGFTALGVGLGPGLYRLLGGTGGALATAVAYGHIVFAGALGIWTFNTLASVVRGTGNMVLPAALVVAGAALTLVLSPALILGWGPFPAWGVAGAGIAFVTYYALGSAALLGYLVAGRGLVRLRVRGARLAGPLFREILKVGAPASLNTIQTNLTVAVVTGLVGPFGTPALAGYGMGSRLEYLQIPLVFGFGAALVTMVGTNIGAGQPARAQRVAWVGAALAAALTGTIGLVGAIAPHAWLGLFSADAEVLAAGSLYLRIVGPTYGFFGAGLALYFASQGAGRLLWPLVGGASRLAIAAVGGIAVTRMAGGGLAALFVTIAVAFVVFGVVLVVAVRGGAWGPAAGSAGAGMAGGGIIREGRERLHHEEPSWRTSRSG